MRNFTKLLILLMVALLVCTCSAIPTQSNEDYSVILDTQNTPGTMGYNFTLTDYKPAYKHLSGVSINYGDNSNSYQYQSDISAYTAGNSTYVVSSAVFTFPAHTYTSTGNYTVAVTLSYEDSTYEGFTFPVLVKSNQNLEFSYEYLGEYTVRTYVTGTKLQGDVYYWDFGDRGGIVAGDDVTHTYLRPGIYTVRLTSDLTTMTASDKVPAIQTRQELDLLSQNVDLTEYDVDLGEGESGSLIDWLFGWIFGG